MNVSSLAEYSTVCSDHLRDNQNSARYTFNVYATTVEFGCIWMSHRRVESIDSFHG